MVSKLFLNLLLATVAGAAKDSCGLAKETALLQVSSQNPGKQNFKKAFVGLKVKAGKQHKRHFPMELNCRKGSYCRDRTEDGICVEWSTGDQCSFDENRDHRGTHTLKWNNVKKVVFQSFGVKVHTRNYIIRTESAGSFTVFSKFNGNSAPTGSGLRALHRYTNTSYTFEPPAVFTAGDPGYLFYGSFEIMQGATITLMMNDGKPFELISFDADKFEISR